MNHRGLNESLRKLRCNGVPKSLRLQPGGAAYPFLLGIFNELHAVAVILSVPGYYPRCGTCVLPPPNESYDLLFRQSAKTDVVRVPPSIIIRISPIPLRYLVNDHVQRRSVERTVIY